MDSVHEAGQHRHNSPANQYSGDPDARADFVQQQIAGDFKDGVAEKENPKEQSVLLAADGQLFVHRQRRKPNVDAIEKGYDEKNEDKGKNPDPHFPDRSGLDAHGTSGGFVGQDSPRGEAPPAGRFYERSRLAEEIWETLCLEG